MLLRAKERWGCQRLGEMPATDLPLMSSVGEWSCQHLDCRLLASRVVQSQILFETTQLVVLC